MRSTDSLPKVCSIRLRNSSRDVSTARSAPRATSATHFFALRAVATTDAPARFASWIAAVPTPEAAAWTRTRSPAFRPPSWNRFRYAVNHASGIAAASANESEGGIGMSMRARHRHFLGVAASGEQEEDALPGALHLARRLEAEDLRGARRRRVLALRLQQVGAVHGGRAHVDDDLAGAGHRIRRLAPDERFGSAGLRDEDGFHADSGLS